MSTFAENNNLSVKDALSSKVSNLEKESLAEFVKRVREEKKLSLVSVRENSGNDIATSYISRIENGEEIEIGLKKLQALAKGLHVTEAEIFALAGIDVDEKAIAAERFFQIAEGYAHLSEQEQHCLEPLLMAIELTIERSEQYQKSQEKSKSSVQKSNSTIPTMTYKEAKVDDSKKSVRAKKEKKK